MREVQASEAKTKLPALLGDVERGESIIITRHGKAIARLVPAQLSEADERAEAVADLRRWRTQSAKSDLSVDELLFARDAGRKA